MLLCAVILAVLYTACGLMLCLERQWTPLPTMMMTLFFYLFSMLVILLGRKVFVLTVSGVTTSADISLEEEAFSLISSFRQPALLCDENGQITWNNKPFSRLAAGSVHHEGKTVIFGRSSSKGEGVSALLGVSVGEILAVDELDVEAFGSLYGIRGYRVHSQNKDQILLIFTDKTEQAEAVRQRDEENSVVAYILIDNLEEMMQYVQEKYRAVTGEIETVLKTWAEEAGGFLKEYERNRYLFLFSAGCLPRFFAENFDILDRIREIRIGEGSLPVTISMGVSGTEGSYAEKDKNARAALDMALQRGGDQVAVKTGSGMEYFGGRSRGVQKMNKVRSRVVANELIMQLSKSSNVLIMAHRNMDFDALGACAAAAKLAGFCGVRANIIINENDPNMKRSYRLLRKLDEYRSMFISGTDALELMDSESLLVICDVNNPAQFEAPDVAERAYRTVIVDHHRKTAEFKQQPVIAYIEPSASSASELMAEILEQVLPSGSLDKEEADIMFAGILLDTKHFTQSAGTRTFSASLYLRSEGANPADAERLFQVDLDSFLREARFQSNMFTYRKGIGIAVNENPDNDSTDRVAAAKAADKLLKVEGIVASFALCKIGDDVVISARSNGSINVQLIAEKLGGGGHFDAAATQLKEISMDEALEKLKNAIDEHLEEVLK